MSHETQNNEEKGEPEFWVECGVCKQWLPDWIGSTPCCGSVAYLVEDGKASENITLFASINSGPIEPVTLKAVEL